MLEQGSPCFGHGVARRVVRFEPQSRERHVELLHERRIAEHRGTAERGGDLLGHGEVHAIEHGRSVVAGELIVDAAQTVGRLPIDVSRAGIDLLAITGHKELFGLQGTGALYIREDIDPLPLCYGGTGSRSSELEQPVELPDRFESGTLNAHGISGLKAGVEFVATTGVGPIREHEIALLERLGAGLQRLKSVHTHGPTDQRALIGIVPLTFDTLSPPEVAEILDTRYGVATRAGLHCAPTAHRTIGTLETGTLRVSLSYLNTDEDIDYLLECLSEITAP